MGSGYGFDVDTYFPMALFARLTDIRVRCPERVWATAQARRRRHATAAADGRLMILAADHPARRITAAAGDPLIMGDRRSYLARICRVLQSPLCDGVLGTPDILEDLLILESLRKEAGEPGLLDDRLLVGSINRGGLAGTAFEMADAVTAFTVPAMRRLCLDGAKVMVRIDTENADSGRTLVWCAEAVTACSRAGLPMFLEPLPVVREGGGYPVLKTPDELIRIVGVASGLGESSLGTWIKIPYCEDYERVARSTSCPILMLGGESTGDFAGVLEGFAAGMAAAPNVRGAMVGRNVHHPGPDDPYAVGRAVGRIVHEACPAKDALAQIPDDRDHDLGAFAGAVLKGSEAP